MVMTASTMLTLGTKAPDFSLPDITGKHVSPADFKDAAGLLVIFSCNHCPYVKHVIDPLVALIKEYQAKGLAVVMISANDVANYPEDSPKNMALLAREKGFTFPYLYDETQETAQAYQASCTPDFFLFDKDQKLVYRGQLDDSRPGNQIPVTGKDLRSALDALLAGQTVSDDQRPSAGCNIKWKKGNEPDYFPA